MHADNRRGAEQAAVDDLVALLLADDGDKPRGGRFIVDDADGDFIRNDGGDRLRAGAARYGDHIQSDGTDRGHGLELVELERAAARGVDHARILRNGNKRARKAADVRRCERAAFFHA